MKLLSTAIAAAALISAADAKGFNGFYAGADFGLSNLNTTWKTSGKSDVHGADAIHASKFGTSLGLFLGYNKVFANCLSAGLEFGGDFNFKKNDTLARTAGSRKYTMKRSGFDWDLVAKFGALVNPKTLAFVGFGIKSVKTRYNFTEDNAPLSKFSIKSSKIRPTYQVGLENLMGNDSVALRLVYAFTQGAKKSMTSTNANLPFVAPTVSSVKNNEHQVKLGVSYRF